MIEHLDPLSVRGVAFLVIGILIVAVSLAAALAMGRVEKRWITWQEMVTKSPAENVRTLWRAVKNRAGLLLLVLLGLIAMMMFVLEWL